MAEVGTKSQRELIVAEEPVSRFVETADGNFDGRRSIARLSLLWTHRRAILKGAATGLAFSLAAAFLIPKRYESVARLMPPDQSNSSTAMLAALGGGLGNSARGSGLGALAGDVLGLKSTGDLFVGVLQSWSVENSLINKFDLRKSYGDRHIEDARKDLERKTAISVDRKSGIISIQVTDRDPHKAAAMAQEYVEQLNRVMVQLNTTSAGREREFLEGRLVEVKNDLGSAEKAFSEFASKNTAIDIPSQGKAMIEAAATLEGQLIASQTELESLKQIYTDNNVRVRATQARVDELKRQLQKMGGSSEPTRTTNVGSAADNQSIPSIRQLPILGVPYADLYRNTKVQEAIFETLTEEYELAKVEEVKETPSVKVLDSPNVPEKKSFPPRTLIVVSGTALGIAIASLFIFSRTLWDVTDADDPRKLLAQEIAASFRRQLEPVVRGSRSARARATKT